MKYSFENFVGYKKCTWMNIEVGDSVDGKFPSTISKTFPIDGSGTAFPPKKFKILGKIQQSKYFHISRIDTSYK